MDRLHPSVQRLIRERLGWPALRPVQAMAVAPILDGCHTLITAGTAGGKTEAAALPWLSRVVAARDGGARARALHALWVAPTRALATQMHARLAALGDALGVAVGLRHGDVGDRERRDQLEFPPDLLVTTPESIEALLLAGRAAWLASLRTVVVDELHVFVAGARGQHLACLLSRIEAESRVEAQRIGLSATLADGPATWRRFVGRASGPIACVEAPHAPRERALALDLPPTDDACHDALAASIGGRRALVFCNSRAAVEETTRALADRGVPALAHHGRLSASVREAAESAMRTDPALALVATSTMELGVDIGGLDAVAQLGAPPSVAAFTQRIGRAARRAGRTAAVWVFARSPRDARLAWATITLAMERWVEPTAWPDADAVVRHQLVAMAVEARGLDVERASTTLRRALEGEGAPALDVPRAISAMRDERLLTVADGVLVAGDEAERRFGRRNWIDLCATFPDSRTDVVAESGGVELGTLDAATAPGDVVLLAGRPFRVASVDGDTAELVAAPGASAKASVVWGGRAAAPHQVVQERAVAGPGSGAARPSWVTERAWAAVASTR